MGSLVRRGARLFGLVTALGGGLIAGAVAPLSLASEGEGQARDVPSARVELTLSPDLTRVDGRVRIAVRNETARTLEAIPLWTFPERLRRAPTPMDDVAETWIFPNGFDPGGLIVDDVQDGDGQALAFRAVPEEQAVGHGPQAVAPVPAHVVITLAAALKPGATQTLDVRFRVRVPERYGPFGTINGQLTVDGGVFPRPPPQAAEGFQLAHPPGDVDFCLAVAWRGPVGESRPALSAGRLVTLKGGARPVVVSEGRADRVSLTVLPRATVSRMVIAVPTESPGQPRPVSLIFVHRRPRQLRPAVDGVHDLGRIDTHGETLATVASAMMHLDRWTGGVSTLPDRLVLVEAPLRRDLAIGAPGMVLVSDRAFELIPWEPFAKLHRAPIVRAAYTTLLRERVFAREGLFRRDRVLDLLAVHVSEHWEVAQYTSAEGAAEVLDPAGFLASVDEVIYAPQLPFQPAIFKVVDDTDALRDRFTLFSHREPSGRLLHTRLVDLAGMPAVDRAVRAMLAPGGPSLRAALDRVAPQADEAYVARWDGTRADTNYRLGEVRAVGPRTVEVTVHRDGGEGVVEPVTVQVRAGGVVGEATWHGAGDSATVRVEGVPADAPRSLLVDPDRRLVERDLGAPVDPYADNRSFTDWKFLIEGFSFGVSAATGALAVLLRARLEPRHELRHRIFGELYELNLRRGAALTWSIGFGPKLRPNRLRDAVAVSLAVEQLKASEGNPHGVGARLGLGVGSTTVVSRHNPLQGHSLSVRGGVLFGWVGDAIDWGGYVEGEASKLWRVDDEHVLGGHVLASTLFGSVGPSQSWLVGGPGLVRALDPAAALGKHRLKLSLEWRHRMDDDLLLGLAHLAFVTSVHGVAFVDAMVLSDSYEDLVSPDSVWFGVGYGLRWTWLALGLTPLIFAFDVSYPIHAGRYGWVPAGFPLSVTFGIDHAF